MDLLKNLLQYTPTQRLQALDALTHEFFDELRQPETELPDTRGLANGNVSLPPLFNFSARGSPHPSSLNLIMVELSIKPELNKKLVPAHARAQLGIDLDTFTPMRPAELRVKLD